MISPYVPRWLFPARPSIPQRLLGMTCGLALLAGCASNPMASLPDTSAEATSAAAQSELESVVLDFNVRSAELAGLSEFSSDDREYRLGPGDVITVDAHQVEELRQYKVRIEGQGTVALPLIGRIDLGGLTVGEAEQRVTERLLDYLFNPQVTIFIDDYRSQEIMITGEVVSPGIYPIRQPRSLFEVLTMAGGLKTSAGLTATVTLTVRDPESGQPEMQTLLIRLDELVRDARAGEVVLRGGDRVHVPRAGVFFVDGAVRKPGSYSIQGRMDLLNVMALAGGPLWSANERNVRVVRRGGGENRIIDIDMAETSETLVSDFTLQDGDIVIVGYDPLKRGFENFWFGITSIFNVRRNIWDI